MELNLQEKGACEENTSSFKIIHGHLGWFPHKLITTIFICLKFRSSNATQRSPLIQIRISVKIAEGVSLNQFYCIFKGFI